MLQDYVLNSTFETTLKSYIQDQDRIQIKGRLKCTPGQQCGEPDQDACTAQLSCAASIAGPNKDMIYATFQEAGGSSTHLVISKEKEPENIIL